MSLLRAFGLFLLQIPLILIGFVVVAVLIPFRKTDETTRKPFISYPELGTWVFSNIPGWFGNLSDGVLGDKRGWFANWCVERGIKYPSFAAMWIWAAVRNPINRFSRVVIGCDVSRCRIVKVWGDDVVEEVAGQRGWQYLLATRDDGKEYGCLRIVLPWCFKPTNGCVVYVGWKIKLSHNGTPPDAPEKDRLKGDTFNISLWKSL